ncbi:MAG TPA: hypothetical protein VI172_14740 [Candidatus Dormibacteraeota bacterium]|jgi:hypothetical protein
MTELHIPEWNPHRCAPTQDAYDAACRAIEKHRNSADQAMQTISRLRDELTAIRDLAYRGTGSPTDALQAIQARARRAAVMD